MGRDVERVAAAGGTRADRRQPGAAGGRAAGAAGRRAAGSNGRASSPTADASAGGGRRRDRRRRRPRHVRLDAARRCPSGPGRSPGQPGRPATGQQLVERAGDRCRAGAAPRRAGDHDDRAPRLRGARSDRRHALGAPGPRRAVPRDGGRPDRRAERADRRPGRVDPARRRPAGARRRRDHAQALRRGVPAARRPGRVRPAIRRRQPRLPRGHRGVRRRGAARAGRDRPRRERVG